MHIYNFTPTLLSFFLTQQVNFENYQNDVFIKQFVDSCKIGEEKQWYHDSVPLNKLLISILKDFSKKFDASEKLRKDAQACFEFGDTPLYLNNSNSETNLKNNNFILGCLLLYQQPLLLSQIDTALTITGCLFFY
ncbi:hypothetical protein ACTFIR_009445 [Dictyostelium discoideum]